MSVLCLNILIRIEEELKIVSDQFRNLTNEESNLKLGNWFEDLEYIPKLKVLLRVYPDLNITKIESQGIDVLWKKIPLERQKDIYNGAWKY